MLDTKSSAQDLMVTQVVTLRDSAPIEEAMALLEDSGVGGAPVVDAGGQCVGVFSLSDLLKRGVELRSGETPRVGDYFSLDPFAEDCMHYRPNDDCDDIVLPVDTVGHWMTTTLQSVAADASVATICRKMARHQIHRVLVMTGPKLLGIVTSFDIVRALSGEE